MSKIFQNFLFIALLCFIFGMVAYGSQVAYRTHVSLKETRAQTKILGQDLKKIAKEADTLNMILDKVEKTFTEGFDSLEKDIDSACTSLREISSSLP
jgi:hypothetical protein